MEGSRHIDRIVGIRKILNICLRSFLINSDILSVDRDPGIDGLGIQNLCSIPKGIGNGCASVLLKLFIQSGQFILHFLISRSLRKLIAFCSHCDPDFLVKKFGSKICIQCLIDET